MGILTFTDNLSSARCVQHCLVSLINELLNIFCTVHFHHGDLSLITGKLIFCICFFLGSGQTPGIFNLLANYILHNMTLIWSGIFNLLGTLGIPYQWMHTVLRTTTDISILQIRNGFHLKQIWLGYCSLCCISRSYM